MNIVITGASRGIGYETAKMFAVKGKHNVIAIARNAENLMALSEECLKAKSGSNLHTLAFNLNSGRDLYDTILKSFILKHFGRVDILINNAGYLVNKKISEIEENEVSDIFNVNVFSPIKLISVLLPYMGGAERSHIVNIGSMGGFQGSKKFPGLAAYSASKGALSILTECMAEEFRDMNIAVNCLALGAVNTEMLEQAFPGFKAPVSSIQMAGFITKFSIEGMEIFNGKILPVSLSL